MDLASISICNKSFGSSPLVYSSRCKSEETFTQMLHLSQSALFTAGRGRTLDGGEEVLVVLGVSWFYKGDKRAKRESRQSSASFF